MFEFPLLHPTFPGPLWLFVVIWFTLDLGICDLFTTIVLNYLFHFPWPHCLLTHSFAMFPISSASYPPNYCISSFPVVWYNTQTKRNIEKKRFGRLTDTVGIQTGTAGKAWQQENGVSHLLRKLADHFHPHRESQRREEEVETSCTTSKLTLMMYFSWKAQPPKGSINFPNSAANSGPSVQTQVWTSLHGILLIQNTLVFPSFYNTFSFLYYNYWTFILCLKLL